MTAEHLSRPIAVFDSGLGGLTVVAAVHRRLPQENLLFLADRARVPYASLSIPLIARFASECVDFLLSHDPKAVVIACNTVSSVSLEDLELRSPVPVIGVIKPTARAAAEATRSRKIGVIATSATVRRRAYERALDEFPPGFEVTSNGCPLFVPLVEEGWTEGEIPRKIVAHYLAPLRAAGVDTLILGCTHYEYFRPMLQEEMGPEVNLIHTPDLVAEELAMVLAERNELDSSERPGSVRVYSTDVNDALFRVVNDLFPVESYPGQITVQSAQIPPQTLRSAGSTGSPPAFLRASHLSR